MTRITIGLWIALAVSFSGCDQSTTITTEDIARAQNMKKWRVHLPDDMSEEAFIGIDLKHANGKVHSSGERSGYEPGATITVLMWQEPGADRWRFAMLDENTTLRGSIKDEYGGGFYMYPHDNNSVVEPGDYLIKGSEEGSVSDSQPLGEKEYGFTVKVKNP